MKFWFDNILVDSWLPEGSAGIWSIKKTVIPGNRLTWLASGGDEFGDMLAPATYTGLFRKLDDGSEQRVMFDEPREIKEALAFVEKAEGKILVTGLGIGMVAAWLASKKEVTQVDVIEKNIDVINLVTPYLPSSKIRVIHADAFDYKLTEKYDSAWHDCFYVVPENTEKLTSQFPVERQEIWVPGIMKQPIARRSFLRTALVAIAGAVLAIKLPRKVNAFGTAFVQQKAAIGNATLDAGTISGNSLVATLMAGAGGTITAVSGGGTWVKDVAVVTGIGETSIWHVHNATPGTTAITTTVSGRGIIGLINVQEWSGLTNAGAEATNSNSNAGSNTVTTNSVTPASTNSLVIANGTWLLNDYASGPINSFARLTPIDNGLGSQFMESAYQTETSAAARSTGYGLTAGIAWAAAIAAFGATASAAAPTNGGIFFSGNA